MNRKSNKPAKPFKRKLSDTDVDSILVRRLLGEHPRDLAEEFGISLVYVGQIGRSTRITPFAERLLQLAS